MKRCRYGLGGVVALMSIGGLVACSDGEPDLAAWPTIPFDLEPYNGALESVVTPIQIAQRVAWQDDVEGADIPGPDVWMVVLDDISRDEFAEAFADQLTTWDELDIPSDSIGRAWEHGGQRVVIAFFTIDEHTYATIDMTVRD